MRRAQMKQRRKRVCIRNQSCRQGATHAAAPHVWSDVEVPNAPMPRRGVVFVEGLRRDCDQGVIFDRAPNCRQRVVLVTLSIPAIAEPPYERVALKLSCLTQRRKAGGQSPDFYERKAHDALSIDLCLSPR